ncbi:MAG: hypothetical protein LAP13_06750 [Acidobacteriia bacterium]|nr:hypothetical protein [Terriglobia bacterium]
MRLRKDFGVVVLLALVTWEALGQESSAPSPQASVPSATATESSKTTSPETGTLSQDEIRELIRTAAEHDMDNDKKSRDYTYILQEQRQKLDGSREPESKTYEVMTLYDEQVRRLITKNGQPLTGKDAAKEEEKIQHFIDKRKKESEDDRRKRLDKQEKEREKARQFVREVSEAYNFRLVGMEEREGREDYVIDAEPRPGFQPHSREARVLSKFRFRVWIDKSQEQWVKLDAQSIDTVSFGWFLARLRKGARVLIEQTYVNDDVWLPRHVNVTFDARLGLLKRFNENIDANFRDYKKFRADAKIVPPKEVGP